MDARVTRYQKALEAIAGADTTVFDDETGEEVEVSMDAEEMAVIAENALHPPKDPAAAIRNYLEIRDNRLQAGTFCRDTHEGCERALRDVYLLACGEQPENGQ